MSEAREQHLLLLLGPQDLDREEDFERDLRRSPHLLEHQCQS